MEDGSYAATVPGHQGVRAVGSSFEECRKDLIEVIEEWIVARRQWGYPIPHHGEKISVKLQLIILKEAGISRDDWLSAA